VLDRVVRCFSERARKVIGRFDDAVETCQLGDDGLTWVSEQSGYYRLTSAVTRLEDRLAFAIDGRAR
jgi:hypothetical protein